MELLEALLGEYHLARQYSEDLVEGLGDEQMAWRPHEQSSGIGWHLGHQAAVNHFMVRNLTAAEPSLNPEYDALFDSATVEPERGDLPSAEQIFAYRSAVAATTTSIIEKIGSGDVGAPKQLGLIGEGLLRAVINHEYQHDKWVLEVRQDLGNDAEPAAPSTNAEQVEGYWMVSI